MTTQLTNEWTKLVNYLDSQKKIESHSKSQTPKPVTKKDVNNKVTSDTKKFLEEAKIEDFNDLPQVNFNKNIITKAFDVERFESLMRSKLIEEHKTRQSYERPYISCSELYNCIRQNYYSRKRYQTDLKKQYHFSYLYLIQKVGNKIHDIFQDLYDFTEVEKTIVSEKYKVKGRVDALTSTTLHEIKSIDPDKFKNKYIKDHYHQGVIYAEILINEYDYPIDTISITYVLRNLKKIRVFELPINEKIAKSFLERAPILLTALEANQVPETIGTTNENCNYCPYKNYCQKDGYKTIIPPYEKQVEKKKDNEPVFLL